VGEAERLAPCRGPHAVRRVTQIVPSLIGPLRTEMWERGGSRHTAQQTARRSGGASEDPQIAVDDVPDAREPHDDLFDLLDLVLAADASSRRGGYP